MKQALLIIDVQNDYFEGGAMTLAGPDQALSQINRLETYFVEQSLPVIYIQHINPPEATFFRPNTSGVELHAGLKRQAHAIVIPKNKPNSFLNTSLEDTLKTLEIEQLVITGMMTHMCIDSSTRAAAERGYQPILIADATATRDLTFENHTTPADAVQHAFLSALTTFADVQSTAAFLQAHAAT